MSDPIPPIPPIAPVPPVPPATVPPTPQPAPPPNVNVWVRVNADVKAVTALVVAITGLLGMVYNFWHGQKTDARQQELHQRQEGINATNAAVAAFVHIDRGSNYVEQAIVNAIANAVAVTPPATPKEVQP